MVNFTEHETGSPDYRLNEIRLSLRIHLGYVRKSHVINVIAAASVVVTNVVALLAITDRMVAVVTRTLGRETHADRGLVRSTTIL